MMPATTCDRLSCARLSEALAYPGEDFPSRVALIRQELIGTLPRAARALEAFERRIDGLGPDALQELYTRTFDVAPQCIPYVSVHLFGEESFKRAELMAGLIRAYRREGFDWTPELPDHLAVILRFAPGFQEEEWIDMATLCLKGPVRDMRSALERHGNPYAGVLSAVQAALEPDSAPDDASDDLPDAAPEHAPDIASQEGGGRHG